MSKLWKPPKMIRNKKDRNYAESILNRAKQLSNNLSNYQNYYFKIIKIELNKITSKNRLHKPIPSMTPKEGSH